MAPSSWLKRASGGANCQKVQSKEKGIEVKTLSDITSDVPQQAKRAKASFVSKLETIFEGRTSAKYWAIASSCTANSVDDGSGSEDHRDQDHPPMQKASLVAKYGASGKGVVGGRPAEALSALMRYGVAASARPSECLPPSDAGQGRNGMHHQDAATQKDCLPSAKNACNPARRLVCSRDGSPEEGPAPLRTPCCAEQLACSAVQSKSVLTSGFEVPRSPSSSSSSSESSDDEDELELKEVFVAGSGVRAVKALRTPLPAVSGVAAPVNQNPAVLPLCVDDSCFQLRPLPPGQHHSALTTNSLSPGPPSIAVCA